MRPNYDFLALRVIEVDGVVGYNTGDGVMADAVAALGLVVGEDVEPASPNVIARPADGAPLADWSAYAVGQGADLTAVFDAARDEIRAMFPPPAGTPAPRPKSAKRADG